MSGGRTKLWIGLMGGMVVTPEWLLTDGKMGLGLSVRSAIQFKRTWWISDAFKIRYPSVAGAIDAALNDRTCKWKSARAMFFVRNIAKPK